MKILSVLTAISLAVSLLFSIPSRAAAWEIEPLAYEAYADRLISSTYTDSRGCTLPYRLYLPEDYAERSCPVILSLHGAGERGSDNEIQAQGGILPYILADDTLSSEAIIISPQCPEEGQWVDVPWSIGVYFTEDVPESPYLSCAVSLMLDIAEEYGADMSRLYATGYSMGGYGIWDILARYPGLLAAALPLCGGGDSSKAELYKNVPIKTYHCTEDGVVPFIGTQAIVGGIEDAGGSMIDFVIIEAASHDAWNPAYSDRETLTWLLSQKKEATAVTEAEEAVTEADSNPLAAEQETAVTDTQTHAKEEKNSSGTGALIAVGIFFIAIAVLSCAMLFRREQFYS
ncbi:MAG: hypothetical protein J6I45_04605 [Clostridia bacterium]|nr:hypothetical protein [Clostridia bacterium]